MILRFVIMFLFVLLDAAIGSGDTINLDHVKLGKLSKCGEDVTILEGKMMELTFTTKTYTDQASCTNDMSNANNTLKNQYGKRITATFNGEDDHEGDWTCTFVRIINKDSDENKYFDYTNCSITVKIQHSVHLTITNRETSESVTAINNMTYYHFKPNEKVFVECKKGAKMGSLLKSGSLMLKLCFKNGYCADYNKTGNSIISDDMTILQHLTDGQIICIYTSKFGEQYQSQVVFRREPTHIINIDEVINAKMSKCGSDIIVMEGYFVSVTFSTSKYINRAGCRNILSNENIDVKNEFGTKFTANFSGESRHEGEWACSFLRVIDADINGSVDGKYYDYTNCSIAVKIKHQVKLTVTSSPVPNYAVAASTNGLSYYDFKPGDRIIIECKKDSDAGSDLQSGSLMVKHCFSDGICANFPRSYTSTIYNDMILDDKSTGSMLHCIYTNRFNETYQSSVEFRWSPGLPEISEVGQTREPKALRTRILFDGKVGESKTYECKNVEKTGNIHWEICRNSYVIRCTTENSSTTKLTKEITLKEGDNGSIVKCVYTNQYYKKADREISTSITLFANKPPVLKISGERVKMSNLTSDTYVIEGEVNSSLEIRCSHKKSTNFRLYWNNCKDCRPIESEKYSYIDERHTLKLEDNNKTLFCAYNNSRGKEISSKSTFIVHPKPETVNSEPPVLTIGGEELDLFNTTTLDTHVIKGETGTLLGIKCTKKENNAYLLYWKDCPRKTDQNCKIVKSTVNNAIERLHTLILEDNDNILYCAYKNARGEEVSTKVIFIVRPKVNNEPNPAPDTASKSNQGSLSNTPTVDSKATSKSVQPSHLESKSPSSPVSSREEPKIYIDMYSDTKEVYSFNNGDTLKFICNVFTAKYLTYAYKIELKSSGRIFSVPVKYCNNNNESGEKLCYGFYKMNFTSPKVDVTCYSIYKLKFLPGKEYMKTITLTRKESSVYTSPTQPVLKITNQEGQEVEDFKNGDTLLFKCSDPNNRNIEIVLKSESPDHQNISLTLTTDINNKIAWSRHTMYFTSYSIEATCYSVSNKNVPLARHSITIRRIKDTELSSKAAGSTGSQVIGFFDDKKNLIYLAIGGGICIIVIAIFGIIRAFKKGKQDEAMIQRASVNYEHFTNESREPTPPFPKGPKLEQTYLAPVDLMESPYATSKPQQDTDTYALPYTPSNVEELYSKPVPKTSRINAMYSQVLPKSLRKGQNSSKYVNSGANDELTYAEISHKSVDVSNKPYANVGDKSKKKDVVEDNYATVAHSNAYANLDKDKTEAGKSKDDHYTNVFANDPYVNAKSEDYAEPSYCELSRKN